GRRREAFDGGRDGSGVGSHRLISVPGTGISERIVAENPGLEHVIAQVGLDRMIQEGGDKEVSRHIGRGQLLAALTPAEGSLLAVGFPQGGESVIVCAGSISSRVLYNGHPNERSQRGTAAPCQRRAAASHGLQGSG